jgi:anti-sigma factor RsiW
MSEFPMSIHELLPWYLNGTLASDEAAEFERHIPACKDCARELELLKSLEKEIGRHGEAFFAPHPAPELLVTEALEGLPEPQSSELHKHLAFCSTCAAEVRIVRERHGPATPIIPHPARLKEALWKRIIPWAAAAGVAVALALPLWRASRQSVPQSDVLLTTYLEPLQRAVSETRVEVPASVGRFQLVIPVRPPAGGISVSLEIQDAQGKTVLWRENIKDLYRNQFIFVLCDRKDFPDGEYRARIQFPTSPGAINEPPLDFRFHVETR